MYRFRILFFTLLLAGVTSAVQADKGLLSNGNFNRYVAADADYNLIASEIHLAGNVYLASNTSPTNNAAKITIKEEEFTFQPVYEGDEITHDFIVQNKGDATLDIINVNPG